MRKASLHTRGQDSLVRIAENNIKASFLFSLTVRESQIWLGVTWR